MKKLLDGKLKNRKMGKERSWLVMIELWGKPLQKLLPGCHENGKNWRWSLLFQYFQLQLLHHLMQSYWRFRNHRSQSKNRTTYLILFNLIWLFFIIFHSHCDLVEAKNKCEMTFSKCTAPPSAAVFPLSETFCKVELEKEENWIAPPDEGLWQLEIDPPVIVKVLESTVTHPPCFLTIPHPIMLLLMLTDDCCFNSRQAPPIGVEQLVNVTFYSRQELNWLICLNWI